mmetsp:Transcript_35420/g.61843  ORF Transcript_35420/g.61843 Transcript_35420/m.61843 type:complete len:209 (-) Transcript_35420:785-1411(-)
MDLRSPSSPVVVEGEGSAPTLTAGKLAGKLSSSSFLIPASSSLTGVVEMWSCAASRRGAVAGSAHALAEGIPSSIASPPDGANAFFSSALILGFSSIGCLGMSWREAPAVVTTDGLRIPPRATGIGAAAFSSRVPISADSGSACAERTTLVLSGVMTSFVGWRSVTTGLFTSSWSSFSGSAPPSSPSLPKTSAFRSFSFSSTTSSSTM